MSMRRSHRILTLDFADRLLLVANGVVQLVLAMRCLEEVVKASPSLRSPSVAYIHTNKVMFTFSLESL